MSKNKHLKHTIAYQFAAPIFLLILSGFAFSQSFQPVFNPSMELQKTNGTIKIDGRIDAGEWKYAQKADNFVERRPGENLKPDVNTEAFITYDQDNLYVAFMCYDDPSKIRATICQRDQFHGGSDDAVVLLIDTYGNATWAYELMVNPYGIQKDLIWSSIHGEDSGFDLIWESAGSVTSSGYQVEMAIPFTSLRFPNRDVQTWKVDFYRNYPRETFKQYSWAAYDQDDQCWPCQWGTVNGIQGVKPGKGLEILPTFIGSQVGSLPGRDLDSSWYNGDINSEMSLGGKYSLSSDMTMEAAFNPDFSQIEADAAQIDVNSTIALFYPERRPFFQEGRDIFQTLFNSFYTRMVNDPQYAAKLTGRMDRYNVGFLSAYDDNTPYMIPLEERTILVNTGKSYVNILRATKAVGEDNHLGFILTDRRFDGGGYNSMASFDSDISLSRQYSVVGQYIMSFTKEQNDSLLNTNFNGDTFDNGKHTVAFDGETYHGDAFITQLRRRARNWNFTVDFNYVAPSYRTETGYDPWNNYRNFSIWNGFNFYPEKSIFESISPQLWFNNRWNYDGERKWNELDLSVVSDLRWAQTYVGLSMMVSEEQWGGVDFNDLWNAEFFMGSNLSDAVGFEMNFNYGPAVAVELLEKGNEMSFWTYLYFKPIDRLMIEPTINYRRSEQINTGEVLYKQFIWRTRFQLQATRELSARLVVQYNDRWDNWDIDPLITYRISSFSVFYVGSTHDITELTGQPDDHKVWKQTSQQFFMKLQYLFRL
jgi:hypothetical protein